MTSRLSSASLAWLLFAALPAGAQVLDPRDVKDPREVADPRDAADPRATTADPREPLAGGKFLDALWAAGDEARLAASLRENAWSAFAYVDAQTAAWLELADRPDAGSAPAQEKLAALATKARRIAELADAALGDTQFSLLVATRLAWTAEQRAGHRQALADLSSGLQLAAGAPSADGQRGALTPLRKAHEALRVLGESHGQARAAVAIARIHFNNGEDAEARMAASGAAPAARAVRDLDLVWDALSLQYESCMRSGPIALAEEALRHQYLIALDLQDQATAAEVLQQLVEVDKLLRRD